MILHSPIMWTRRIVNSGLGIQGQHSSKAPQKLDEEAAVHVAVWAQICTLPMALVLTLLSIIFCLLITQDLQILKETCIW